MFRWIPHFFLFCLAAAISSAATGDGESMPTGAAITRIEDIRNLSRAEAAEARPVRLRGVVTWQDTGGTPSFFIHDGEWNIYIDRATAMHRRIWLGGDDVRNACRVGTVVEIEGKTDPGGYAPVVIPVRFRAVGRAPLPHARVASLEDLLSGREDGQRVLVEGVVQAVLPPDDFGDSKVLVMVDGHLCRVASENGHRLDANRLVDARVRIRGILVPLPNLRAEAAGLRMVVMGPEDFEILEPPPEDPFLAERVALNHLLPFSPHAKPFHRKVTSGVVLLAVPGRFFFLQDGARSVRVDSDTAVVEPGDLVEVAGFIDTSRTLAALTGAIVRKTGTLPLPAPAAVTVEKILNPDFRNVFEKVAEADFSGRRVRLTGQLVRVDAESVSGAGSLLMESDGFVFPIRLSRHGMSLPPGWVPGARVEATGVVELDFKEDDSTQGSIAITGLRLWIGGVDDLHVISVPSWWTPRRLGVALAGVIGFLALALGWNIALRRLLDKRGRLLESVMREHRNSEIRFEGARQERRRVASDLHDGLQQLMAGAAYRLEAAVARMGHLPSEVDDQVTAARRALLRAQTGLREALWGLRHLDDDADDFAALLRHAVESVEHWPEGAVEVEVGGEPYPVSRQVMGSLLLLMQETVGNAFKHGRAGRVKVSLNYDPAVLELRIVDDGVGFDPGTVPGSKDGHFGLESARLRMKWLGGTVSIQSSPGHGASIICTVPKNLAAATRESLASSDTSSNPSSLP